MSSTLITPSMKETPTLKGKQAKRFYSEINQGKVSDEHKKFIEECLSLLHR